MAQHWYTINDYSDKKPNKKYLYGQFMELKSVEDAAPLYRQVSGTLKEEILRGVYPVGSLLPTEVKLRERFGVSRHTVREALRLLREGGLVASRRGSGTVVTPPRTGTGDVHRVMSVSDLLAFAAGTHFAIEAIDTVTIDAALARATGLAPGEDWLEVRGYRHDTNGAPLCRTLYYINRAFAAVGRMLPRHSGPIFPLIEDMFGQNIVQVHQQITATLLDAELARGLDAKEGTAALEVRRAYVTAEEETAQVTINIHPSERFQHAMTMRRLDA